MVSEDVFTAAPIKPTVSYGVFEKIDIRVGMIELVEDVPKSDKLVRLTVDFGDHKRTILVAMKKERRPNRNPGQTSSVCSEPGAQEDDA
jgi:tRNA-binding protein